MNDAIIAAISFLETRRSHERPCQVSKESLLATDSCFSSSVSSQGTNFGDIGHMFRSPLWILWSFPCESLTCQPSLRWYIVRLWKILWTFLTFSYLQPVREQRKNWQSSTEVCPHLNRENHLKVCFTPMACHQKLFRVFYLFLTHFSQIWSKTLC